MMTRIALPFLLASLAVLEATAPSAARASQEAPAYRLSVDLDVPLLLVGAGLTSSYFLMSETAPPACAPLCDRARVNALDRPAAGLFSRRWATTGDIATVSTLVIVPLALVLDEGARNGLNDVVVVAEAALSTAAVQVPVSYAVARPRPRVYGENAPLGERNDANAGRSFFSGHVANTVAATVATTRALLRLDHRRMAWAVLAVGLAGSALIGVARVGAGSHFPSDVLVGAAVGVGVGIAVPALHTAGLRVAPIANDDSAGLTVAGAF